MGAAVVTSAEIRVHRELAGERPKELVRFHLQWMSYEMLYRETFADILCPDTVYDLIDYHLREWLRCEIKMRVYKNSRRCLR